MKPGSMSATSFAPKSLAASHRQFGKSASDLVAADGVDPRGPRFQAAQLQHKIANSVRESLLATGVNLETYAERHRSTIPGMSYDRLVRILRGETQMQFADVVTWASQFPTVRAMLVRDQTWPPLTSMDPGV